MGEKNNYPQNKGIVLNRMYAGSYLSANIGHEVINMFCDDAGRHFMYLNATGDFAAVKRGKIGSMLLIKYIGQDEAKHPWAEVLGYATDLLEVYEPNKKQDHKDFEAKAYDENGKETSVEIDDIKYGELGIRKIFEGSSQQDILITYCAKKLYVPQDGTRVFIRYKKYKNNKGEITQYATSDRSDLNPEEGFEDNIKMTKPCYLWKKINNDEDNATLVFKEKSYVIDLENTTFASTSLKQYIDKNNEDLNALHEFLNINLWIENNQKINNNESNEDGNKIPSDSIFDICCLEYSENSFSNALAYFMDKYRKEWQIIFGQWLEIKDLDLNYKIEREVDIKDVVGKGGRIDLLIQDEKNLIIIENKIKSGINSIISDIGGNQLDRYNNYAKKINGNNETLKKIHLYVLSPDYNQPHVSSPWKITTYKYLKYAIKKSKETEEIDNLINDNNFKSFLDVMERHTKENLSDWLKEEMLKKFTRVINSKEEVNNQ